MTSIWGRGKKIKKAWPVSIKSLLQGYLQKLSLNQPVSVIQSCQETLLQINSHFANNIHLHFCSCIKLSNKINSSSVVSSLCHKLLDLFTPPCQVQGIFHPKKLVNGMKLFTLKQWFSNLASYYNNYLYLKLFS